MQYFSSGLALSLCGLRFRVRVELEDDPDDPDVAAIRDLETQATHYHERRRA
jgi:hypothetical protein